MNLGCGMKRWSAYNDILQANIFSESTAMCRYRNVLDEKHAVKPAESTYSDRAKKYKKGNNSCMNSLWFNEIEIISSNYPELMKPS